MLIFNFFTSEVLGQTPNYTHDAPYSRNLDDFSVTIADAGDPQAKLDRIIISVDTNLEGERFVLTFGNGIKRVGNNDGLIDFIPNQNDRLSNPLDFAINSEGKFFVATNESNRRFIRVYSPEGIYLPNEELGTGAYGSGPDKFRGPTGLAFDKEDNLYVADHYIGNSNPLNPSFIKIYRKDALGSYKNNLIKEFDNVQGTLLNFPYRLAVNSKGHLYMAELGQNDNATVKVLEFDNNFNPTQIDEISENEIGSPGSVIIDKFDNIFIADFGEEIDLSRVLEATNDIDEFSEIFEIIRDGIKNNIFKVNIYNPDNTFKSKITSKIDFPIDLAISSCGTLYVNNAIFEGEINEVFIPFLGNIKVPDVDIDFDLEAYKRSPGYDTEAPVIISCPGDDIETLTNGSFSLKDYREQADFSDNCDDDLELVQTPAPGSEQTGTVEVSIIAVDDAGNESQACVFNVVVEEETPPSFSCPQANELPDLDLDENCDFTAPDYSNLLTNFVNFENDPFFVQTETRNGNVLAINMEVFDGQDGNLVGQCDFEIDLIDNISPIFVNCPTSITASFNPDEGYEIPDYSTQFPATDNCNGTINYTQTPIAGTIVFGDTTIRLSATDASENEAECEFELDLTPTQELVISCESIFLLEPEENCIFKIPNLSSQVSVTPASASISQSVSPGTMITENTEVTMTATLNGETKTCTIDVQLVDYEFPEIADCPAFIEVSLAAGEVYTVPDFTQQATASDNCQVVSFTQNLSAGSEITESEQIILTATDGFNNQTTCAFNINITREEPSLPFTCKNSITFQLDSNGEVNITPEDLYNGDGGDYEFSLSESNFTCEDTGEIQIVTLNYTGEIDGSCDIEVDILDFTKPEITCPENIIKTISPGEQSVVVNFDLPEAIDNCAVTIEQTGGLASGNEFPLGISTIEFTATDLNGNFSICSFDIIVNNEENQAPVAQDDTYTTNQDTTLNETAPGVLENDQDAEGNAISAILNTNITNGTLSLNSDGSFTYVPEPGFVGPASFTYTASDGIAESEPATVTINVLQNNTGFNFECIAEISKELNEDGHAILQLEELYSGDATGIEFSISQTEFTCEDLGSNTLRLSFAGNGEEGFCDIEIILVDNLPPNLALRDIEIELNEQGTASISAEDIDAGSRDNCTENLQFTLSRTNFSCKDLGENSIEVNVQDESGNSATAMVTVTVTSENGVCDFKPEPAGDYIFIYPNPNSGSFAINAPRDIIIEKIQVFDNRGRFITKKDFPENTSTYQMNIGFHREAVYVLQIFTNEGEVMRKMIFRN